MKVFEGRIKGKPHVSDDGNITFSLDAHEKGGTSRGFINVIMHGILFMAVLKEAGIITSESDMVQSIQYHGAMEKGEEVLSRFKISLVFE